MTVRLFLVSLLLIFVTSTSIWLMIINWLEPRQNGWLGFAFFFLTFFLATGSGFSLLGYGARAFVIPHTLPAYRVRHSLRQGFLLAGFLNLLLLLQLMRLVQWWVVLILVFLVLSMELVFLSYERTYQRYRHS